MVSSNVPRSSHFDVEESVEVDEIRVFALK